MSTETSCPRVQHTNQHEHLGLPTPHYTYCSSNGAVLLGFTAGHPSTTAGEPRPRLRSPLPSNRSPPPSPLSPPAAAALSPPVSRLTLRFFFPDGGRGGGGAISPPPPPPPPCTCSPAAPPPGSRPWSSASARRRAATGARGNRVSTARRARTSSGCTQGTALRAETAAANRLGTGGNAPDPAGVAGRRAAAARRGVVVTPVLNLGVPASKARGVSGSAPAFLRGVLSRAALSAAVADAAFLPGGCCCIDPSTADAYAAATALARDAACSVFIPAAPLPPPAAPSSPPPPPPPPPSTAMDPWHPAHHRSMQGSVADSVAKQATAAAAAVFREGAVVALLFAGGRRRCPRSPAADAPPNPGVAPALFCAVFFLGCGSRHDPGKMSRRHLVVRSCRRGREHATNLVWLRTGEQDGGSAFDGNAHAAH